MTDKWQTEPDFPKTNLRMLDDEMLCDVTFWVGDKKQTVKAHRFMLASRSPVFHAMFCGPLAESGGVISIPDIEEDIFKLVLRYLYTAGCPITPETVMSLLYAANKYDVIGLARDCKEYLQSNLDIDNVCVILQQAQVFDEKELFDSCILFIEENSKASVESEGFTKLSSDILKSILQSDHLSLPEEDVYKACVKWAEAECKRKDMEVIDENCRSVLGDALRLIRFPLMSLETFAVQVSERSILTDQEKIELFQSFRYAKQKPCTSVFSDAPRLKRKTVIICRFPECVEAGWGYDAAFVDAVSFSCSKSAFLSSACLFSPHNDGTIQGKLEVYKGDSLLASENVNKSYESGVQHFEVKFPTSVPLKKDTIYTIAQKCTGVDTYYGEDGLDTIFQDGLEVKFYDSEQSNNTTDKSRGQFLKLKFELWQRP